MDYHLDGLSFIDGIFVPHANIDKEEKIKIIKKEVKNTKKVAYLVSDCAALVIENNIIKVIKSKKDAYVIKMYWNKKIIEEIM